MRLVIDTNIWIHYLIQRPSEQIENIILDPATDLLFSKELLTELLDVCARPKFVRYFSQEDVSELILLLESRYPIIAVHSVIDACKDKKDNFLLGLCKDGGADYLVTGDTDLLEMQTFESTKIVTLAEFESLTTKA